MARRCECEIGFQAAGSVRGGRTGAGAINAQVGVPSDSIVRGLQSLWLRETRSDRDRAHDPAESCWKAAEARQGRAHEHTTTNPLPEPT
jgi:hypothetical protein